MTQWLPQGYEVPKAVGNYYKFNEGQNKFRVLSNPVMGFVYWNTQNKPVRLYEMPKGAPEDLRMEKDPNSGDYKPGKIKHFWAFAVWSYRDEKVMVAEISQSSIQAQMQDLVLNEDWGDPKGYDITVTKKGEKLDTEYTVQPSPQKPLSAEQSKAYREARVNLEALFAGGDPFGDSVKPAEEIELVVEKRFDDAVGESVAT